MKEKATFNLSLSTLETLETAWIKLKRQFKGEQRVTKTAIVEMALDICISELEDRGSESLLYKKLVALKDAGMSEEELIETDDNPVPSTDNSISFSGLSKKDAELLASIIEKLRESL
jgi:hypothetical protein